MLVVTGKKRRPYTKYSTAELFHLDSSSTQCSVNYPLNVLGAVGWLSEEGFTICGGRLSRSIRLYRDCYTLKDNQWIPWPSMTTARAYASTIKINATQTLILGGYDDKMISEYR